MDDVVNTCKFLEGWDAPSSYDMIYKRSNENLGELFKDFDFNDSRVLTVLASSDQLFNVLKNNPEVVDTYDINKLTKYYYYLRKWNIKYNGKYYLPDIVDSITIRNLLYKVKDLDKGDAYNYWTRLINMVNTRKLDYLFAYSAYNYEDNISIYDIKDKLDKYKLVFNNIDITRDININKKYNYIITSNISEYFLYDTDRLNKYRFNLYNLLDVYGYVISSHLMNKSIPRNEVEAFYDYFDISDINSGDKNIGYVYKKKVSTKRG